MSPLLMNWVICLFFLGALVGTATMKTAIIAVDRRSYSYMAVGVALMALTALIRVFQSVGLINSAAFVGEPLFYHLTTAILLITGLTFAVSGLSSWLLIRKRARSDSAVEIRQLETIKLVEQLAQLENRIDTIFTAALELIVGDYDFRWGVVLKFSSRTGAVRVVSSAGDLSFDSAALSKARFNHDLWRTRADGDTGPICDLLSIPQGSIQTSLSVPIVVDGTPVGIFLLLDAPETARSRQSKQNIRIMADIIARRVELDRRQLCVQFFEETAQFRTDIDSAIVNTEDLRSSAAALAVAVREHVSADILTLLVFHPNEQQLSRYTSSAGGNLVELKIPIPSETTLTGYLRRIQKSVMITDARGTASIAVDGPVAAGTVRSILAVPIIAGDDCLGALILGSDRVNEYTARHQSLIQGVVPVLVRYLQSVRHFRSVQSRLQKYERHFSLMADSDSMPQDEWLRAVGESLAMVAGADCVRVAALEDDGQFMRSVAFSGKAESVQTAPANGLLVLSVLDCHRKVIETARPLVGMHGDADRMITRLELNQVIGERCAGVRIVPLVAHGQVVGTLTFGYVSSDIPSLSAADETILQALASRIAWTIAEPATTRAAGNRLRGYDRAVAANRSERDLRNRLKSPLTGILGSLEMLRARKDAPEVGRYLAIMDKSARRMQEYLEPEDTTVDR
jgi:GAF domain-containing protein